MVEEKQKLKWILAQDAVAKMTADGENPEAAFTTLAAYLRHGQLRARAKRMWISDENELAKAWKLRPVEFSEDVELPVKYWRSHKAWARDVSEWRWSTSSLHVTRRLKPRRRRMMHGVEFHLKDLAKLQPRYFGNGKRSGSRGPDQDVVRRSLVWGEILSMALAGELTDPTKKLFEGKTELAATLYERINGEVKPPKVGLNIISEVVRIAFHRITP